MSNLDQEELFVRLIIGPLGKGNIKVTFAYAEICREGGGVDQTFQKQRFVIVLLCQKYIQNELLLHCI